MGKSVFDDLFTASGRRNRQSYILYCLASAAAFTVVSFIVAFIIQAAYARPDGMSVGGQLTLTSLLIAFLVWAVSSLMVGAQRCRDVGWTGWAILFTAVPFFGLVFAFALWFIPGNQGENRFGPDPLG